MYLRCIVFFFMFRDGQGQIKKAVSTIGRQTNGDTFVFGPTVQLSSIGDIIPDSAWEYIWVPRIVEQGSVIPLASGIEDIPQCRSPLRHLLKGLKLLTQENYVSGVFVLDMLILNLSLTSEVSLCTSTPKNVLLPAGSCSFRFLYTYLALTCCMFQVLQVVNPYCSFMCGPNNKSTPGVAVILKELLEKLDGLNIEHEDEATIRRRLRVMADRTKSVKTSANQFFLKQGRCRRLCYRPEKAQHQECFLCDRSPTWCATVPLSPDQWRYYYLVLINVLLTTTENKH